MPRTTPCTRTPNVEVPESVVLAIDPVCRELDPDQVRAASERGFRLWVASPPYDLPMVPRDAGCVMGVGCNFGVRPLWDYHAQLQLLREASGGTAKVLDVSAQTVRAGSWLDEVAASAVPPSPVSLYTVHSVFEARHRPIWLHTHGLERCGSIELDVVDLAAHGFEVGSGDRAGLDLPGVHFPAPDEALAVHLALVRFADSLGCARALQIVKAPDVHRRIKMGGRIFHLVSASRFLSSLP